MRMKRCRGYLYGARVYSRKEQSIYITIVVEPSLVSYAIVSHHLLFGRRCKLLSISTPHQPMTAPHFQIQTTVSPLLPHPSRRLRVIFRPGQTTDVDRQDHIAPGVEWTHDFVPLRRVFRETGWSGTGPFLRPRSLRGCPWS